MGSVVVRLGSMICNNGELDSRCTTLDRIGLFLKFVCNTLIESNLPDNGVKEMEIKIKGSLTSDHLKGRLKGKWFLNSVKFSFVVLCPGGWIQRKFESFGIDYFEFFLSMYLHVFNTSGATPWEVEPHSVVPLGIFFFSQYANYLQNEARVYCPTLFVINL
jgi:hypothetical protein